MKITFIQSVKGIIGGIESVNSVLADAFINDGHDVSIFYLWKSDKNEHININRKAKERVVSKYILIDRPSYKLLITYIKKLQIIKASKQIFKIIQYFYHINNDYKLLKKEFTGTDENVIILSNPLLIRGLPKGKLSKVLCHMHTGIKYYEKEKRQAKSLKKYNNKIKKFIWLTKESLNWAIDNGFDNSAYIYNPLRIKCESNLDVFENKSIIFLGRFSKEKRLNLLVKMFDEVSRENKEWTLNIYGSGFLDKQTERIIQQNERINLNGTTQNIVEALSSSSVLALTSEYEGLSMVAIESYECRTTCYSI